MSNARVSMFCTLYRLKGDKKVIKKTSTANQQPV